MVIVVGSGAGGATVAKELAVKGLPVLLLEKGPDVADKDAFKHYSNVDSEVKVMRTICLGGTTTVSAGNGVRCLEEELRLLGIDLRDEFVAAEKELGVRCLPGSFFGNGTKKIMTAAEQLGLKVDKMPKFIDPAKCNKDGRCTSGCPEGAKWTARHFVQDAERAGARIKTGLPVDAVVVRNGAVKGVSCGSRFFQDDTVVLAAGALETPRLLNRLGIPTTPLFVDSFITLGGILKGIEFNKEVPMNAVIKRADFILAPHFSAQLLAAMQKHGLKADYGDILGIIIKIKDDAVGEVTEKVVKGVTNRDAAILSEGAAIAGAILKEAGVAPYTFVTTPLRGAHPGGTAKIGVVVDKNMETEVHGLYVADASVLPSAPGAPPILTIVALAKYVSRIIAM
jgi:choline dehydrogenase-like flavoprotein